MIREKDDPLALFGDWLAEAEKSEPNDPNAMALASVETDGMPTCAWCCSRATIRRASSSIPISRAARASEILAHPKAALLFHWKSLRRQVRVAGPVTQTTPAEADDYFATRARGSQIGAWASDQSRPLESRFALEKRVAEFTTRHIIGTMPRPPYWSGFRLQPSLIEFWQDGAFRLHDRLEYRRVAPDAAWTTRTLYP